MPALFEKPAFLVLILLVLLLFGAKRLPELARGVGRSLRIFKSETEGLRDDGAPLASAGTDRDPAGQIPSGAAPTVGPPLAAVDTAPEIGADRAR